MTVSTMITTQRMPAGHALFVRYAYPPNELGYCGTGDAEALLRSQSPQEIETHAKEFDGAWPYLRAIADAAALADPLDARVVRGYWIGGPLLDRVDATALLAGLQLTFAGQRSGLLTELQDATDVLAHHSFHVFVVYPWVGFLDKATTTALHVLQNCRIRWGTVESVDDEHMVVSSRPLAYESHALMLATPVTERIRWRRDDMSLIPPPVTGTTVAAHWDWVCDVLDDADSAALATATQATLDVVNAARNRLRPRTTDNSTPRHGEVKENLMNTPGEQLSEEPQEARGAPGSRDTGSDQPSAGPAERPSGTYEGDEGVPDHGAADDDAVKPSPDTEGDS